MQYTGTMCGIAGFSVNPEETTASSLLAETLLRGIAQRGGHATGAAWWEKGESADVWYNKQPIGVEEFILGYQHVPDGATSALLHTRYATKGDTGIPANNHPIIVGDIVGIHNGVVWNDLELHAEHGAWEREGTVDSEAVFGALAYSDTDVHTVLEQVDGTAALAWFDAEPETLNLARVSTSPLIVGRTRGGSILFASTQAAVKKAAAAVRMDLQTVFQVKEGRTVSYRDGRLVSAGRFNPFDIGRELTEIDRRALSIA